MTDEIIGRWLTDRADLFVIAGNAVMARINVLPPSKETAYPWIYADGKGEGCDESGYKFIDHVICVYTYDFRDKADVGRVLKGLREIGIEGKLYYKTDQATISGIYARGGPFTKKKQRASLCSSDDFEK